MSLFLVLGSFFLALPSLQAERPALPAGVIDTQRAEDRPLPPLEALKRMTVPHGFQVTLFAGEPDVLQPIAFEFDDRGRLWVVECFSYPEWKTRSDRILIFTDTDGDGRFDERKVFWDQGERLTGIQLGFGGVWVTSAPNLLFIPDANGDDVPDGAPVIVLDGWTLQAGHNTVNGLTWGPDGWLFGRHGITAPSLVGKPGTPDDQRTRLSCSIWRYHPSRKVFEAVTHGTTNPWGLDFDDFGQPFFSNNVIGHLWHVIPGAHYQRMFGEDFNPCIYELMEACSDHLHWTGSDWRLARGGKENDPLGGGHSHAGARIYLGDNWPGDYRGALFMVNLHGNRVLYDRLERKGSGYVGRHGGAFLLANDPWFRGVTISYGPDGGMFVSDWNDLGECHDTDGSYRSSGRIYKITYGRAKPGGQFDLAKLTDAELVQLQLHRNDWQVRHARRLLAERAAAGKLNAEVPGKLAGILKENPDVTRKLRALWALHVTGGLNGPLLTSLLDHPSEHVRWWAIQLLCEGQTAPPIQVEPPVLRKFEQLARADRSPLVRLALASALQRLRLEDRWPIVTALLGHAEDARDQNLPLMLWYAIEPMVPADRARALQLLGQCRIPLVRQFISRRLAAN
ncbi:MAG: PVC-type heme-binding CxxCH protein [Verrucomicrobiota bacterium]